MSVLPLDAADRVATTEPVPPTRRRRGLPSFLRRPGGMFGAVWLVFVLVASLTAALWVPYAVDEQDLANRLALPSGAHWLGTDPLGRDILSRIFTAGSLPLLSSLLMLVVAFGIGLPLALIAAERGRRTEQVISRLTEILMALPLIILLLAVIGVIGNRLYPVMAILGVLISAAVYRVMLGVAQSVRQRLYVDAARVNGLGSLRVNLLHVLPSMATVVAVQAAQLFGIGLLINAGLAFLGFGPSEPNPSWGFMIQDASKHLFDDPWLMVPTGLMLAITVVAANELADAIAAKGKAEQRGRRRRPLARAVAAATTSLRPAAPGAVLEVRDLTISVDDGTDLVTRVDFALRPGTVLGLVGESGCGKTMTARSLMGLLPDGVAISGGSIRWTDRELAGLTEAELNELRGREIAMISQEPMVALDPMFSIAYQLVQPIKRFREVTRPVARQIAAELLRSVGIVDAERVLRSYPHQLSGGMAQRVCIALALTGRPRLLIADEPTTALDVTVQAGILRLLHRLCAERDMAVIVITHDLGVMSALARRVYVMYAGRLAEAGPTGTLLTRPRHPYTRGLLDALPHPEAGRAPLVPIGGTPPSLGAVPDGCPFHPRCVHAVPACATDRPGPVPTPGEAASPGPDGVAMADTEPGRHLLACPPDPLREVVAS